MHDAYASISAFKGQQQLQVVLAGTWLPCQAPKEQLVSAALTCRGSFLKMKAHADPACLHVPLGKPQNGAATAKYVQA